MSFKKTEFFVNGTSIGIPSRVNIGGLLTANTSNSGVTLSMNTANLLMTTGGMVTGSLNLVSGNINLMTGNIILGVTSTVGGRTPSQDGAVLDAMNTGTGYVVRTGSGTFAKRALVGAAGQISVTNGDGTAGNTSLSLPSRVALPGTDGLVLPIGNTAQRVSAAGILRYNSDLSALEGFLGTSWAILSTNATVTALTGDITGSGAGTIATTLANTGVGAGSYGSSIQVPALTVDTKGRVTNAAVVAISFPVTSVAGRTGNVVIASVDITDAASTATASTVVRRDANGSFSANTITASLAGQASTAGKLATAQTLSISGDATASANFDGSAGANLALTLANSGVSAGSYGTPTTHPVVTIDAKGRVISAAAVAIAFPVTSVAGRTGNVVIASADITDATAAATPSTVVRRDANGSFSANTITAALSGQASTAAKLTTARNLTISGDATAATTFDGSGDASFAMTLASTGITAGSYVAPNLTVDGKGRVTAIANGVAIITKSYYADHFDNPNNADWSINALAVPTNDPTNIALPVRLFNPGAEQGVGFMMSVPAAASNLTLKIKSRANASLSAAQTVQFRLHRRSVVANSALTAWTISALPAANMPTGANYQYYIYTTTLANLGIPTGSFTQFELTRQGNAATDTMTANDLYLLEMVVEIS